MHLIVIPSWFDTPTEPFRGSFILDQAMALRKLGLKVGIFVPPGKVRSFHGLKEVFDYWSKNRDYCSITKKNNLPVFRLNWWGWKAILFPRYRFIPAMKIYKKYCSQYGRPDIIHAHSILYGGYVAVKMGKMMNIPVVITEHSSTFMSAVKILPGQKRIIRYALKNANRFYTVSIELSKHVERYLPGTKINILPNMVDTEFFSPANQVPIARPFRMIAIGSLRHIKGFHILLRSFMKYFKNKNAHLKIIGEGRQRKYLEVLIEKYDIGHQAALCGKFSRTEVRDEIRKSHVIISSSYKETFGITLIESLACGVLIIATKSGGPETIVNRYNGLLVNKNDVDALGSAMKYMYLYHKNYDRKKIRIECKKKYGENHIAKKLIKTYKELMEKSK
jgi:glycosyltransferase involved in cell wall biosynthesis